MYMNTKKLRKYIGDEISKIDPYIEGNITAYFEARVNFSKANIDNVSGTHVYSDKNGYHVEHIGDRGGMVDKFDSGSLFEISFIVCKEIVTSIAIEYAYSNCDSKRDLRKIIFNRELELLSAIGSDYYQKGYERINAILLDSPYRSDL